MPKIINNTELSQEEREFIHKLFSGKESLKTKQLRTQIIKNLIISLTIFIGFFLIWYYIMKSTS